MTRYFDLGGMEEKRCGCATCQVVEKGKRGGIRCGSGGGCGMTLNEVIPSGMYNVLTMAYSLEIIRTSQAVHLLSRFVLISTDYTGGIFLKFYQQTCFSLQ